MSYFDSADKPSTAPGMGNFSHSRRKVARRSAILSLAALGGCGFVQKSPFFSTLATFNRRAGEKIDRAKVESIPYASMLAWFDGSARALLVLGNYEANDRLIWYSADRQAVTTWGGFVVGLSGLDVSLRSMSFQGEWDKNPTRLVGRSLGRTLDFESPSGPVSVASRSRFVDRGLEDITIFEKTISLRRISEHVTANKWHRYSNDYWVEDASGLCWRSRQVVIPSQPALNTIIGKPPAPPHTK